LPPTPPAIPTAVVPLTPIRVPTAYPTPTGLPPTRLGVYVSEEGWFEYDAKQRGKNPFAEMARFSSAVVLGSIRELDPPIFLTPPTNRWDQPESVLSPAMLQVEHVYRGPSAATLRVVHPGACFTAADCLPDVVHYRWSDLIGYHMLLRLNGPSTEPKDRVYYFPFKVFVVFPDRDEAVDITYSGRATFKLSDVLAQMAPGLTKNP
jgi:hypothetical protein